MRDYFHLGISTTDALTFRERQQSADCVEKVGLPKTLEY